MKRLTAYVSGKVQKAGFRARVMEIARVLKVKGTVENLEDGRVKIVVESDEDKLKLFVEAIDIKNTLINVSSIEKQYSDATGEYSKFCKMVDSGETDSRINAAAFHLKDLTVAVNNMNENLGGKMDVTIQKQDQMLDKQDQMLDKQDKMLAVQGQMLEVQHQMLDMQGQILYSQHDLLDEVRESRRDLKSYLEQRFEKLEGEVAEMRIALKAKGII
ncbi:MAG: acylphosphatase [Methanothrix sp.]|nr:MAG: acylphosphatase [Methanothrix sp.]